MSTNFSQKLTKLYKDHDQYIFGLSKEAIIVGISLVIVSTVVQKILNIRNTMLLMFLSGFVVHIVYDLLGLNKYYCENCLGNC